MDEHPYARTERLLSGTRFGRIRHVAQTASTNADAVSVLGDPAEAGTTIVADRQTHGVGRKGRAWIARPGSGLLFTTILPDPVASADLWCVTFWAALAVRDALSRCGIGVRVRWPNDLLIGENKLCGILCVSRVLGERAFVGCGVGINVTRASGDDERISPPPAFCSDVTDVNRATLLANVLLAFDATLHRLHAPLDVARAWEAAADLPGAPYRLLKDGEHDPFGATGIGLAPGGALIVECDGKREHVALADARALR